MAWISFLFITTALWAAPKSTGPERLLTKFSLDAIRYIDGDGRVAYIKKRPGVLGIVSSFRSEEFVSDTPGSDFAVTATSLRRKVIVEIIRNQHTSYDVLRSNTLRVFNWGDTKGKEVGSGIAPRLHLGDEWLTYFRPDKKAIVVTNLVTDKTYEILLSPKPNGYFVPEVSMPASDLVVYTDQNDTGVAGAITYNLISKKSTVLYKATQNATRLELCQTEKSLVIGEFPYEGVSRSSRILKLPIAAAVGAGGWATVYDSSLGDLGNMVCKDESVYFIKTMGQNPVLGIKTTEAVELNLKNSALTQKTNLETVNHLLNMDGRILAPHRGNFYVLEGEYNLSSETLKSRGKTEGAPLDL